MKAIFRKKGSDWTAEERQRVREKICERNHLDRLYAIAKRRFPQEPEGIWNEFFASDKIGEAGTLPPKSRFDLTIDHYDREKGRFFWSYLKMRFAFFCRERHNMVHLLPLDDDQGGRPPVEDPGPTPDGDLQIKESIQERREAILDCWNQLPPDYKNVFALRYLSEERPYIRDEERAIEEIARVLGISENLVRVRLYRARLEMKECLEQKGIEL